ncbi:hypothetical protein FG94_02883 [Massilia sp. LC238]|nr:hypothetical protein FG94_02883 [Massilia sp. LC238]
MGVKVQEYNCYISVFYKTEKGLRAVAHVHHWVFNATVMQCIERQFSIFGSTINQ